MRPCSRTTMQQDQRTAVQPHSRFMAVHPQSRALAQRRSRALLQQSEKCDLSARLLLFLCQIVNFLYELLTSVSVIFGQLGAPPTSDCPNRKLTQNRGRLAGPKTDPIRECFKESLQGRVRFLDPKMGLIFASESEFWTSKWVPFLESDKSKINAPPMQFLQIKATRKKQFAFNCISPRYGLANTQCAQTNSPSCTP